MNENKLLTYTEAMIRKCDSIVELYIYIIFDLYLHYIQYDIWHILYIVQYPTRITGRPMLTAHGA